MSQQGVPEELLAGLNPEQLRAVTHTSGPMLVVAGAGSGKTRVLTRRIAYLIASGVAPSSILAITFTNKAAAEMKSRVAELVGPTASTMWVSTFHSACVRILRAHAEALGYRKSFAIYDQSDSEKLVSLVAGELGIDPKRIKSSSIAGAISAAKAELRSPDEMMADARHIVERKVAEVYKIYQERLRAANAMDFDDLIARTVELFRTAPAVLEHYQRRFTHLLVDEYQDTNKAQNALVLLLGEAERNVFVVGDSDQSVYGFRGADIRNILDFEKAFADTEVIKLEQNYRSTQNILSAANALIGNNTMREPKRLWSDLGSGERIRIFVADDEREEANFIAGQIYQEKVDSSRRFADFAVFYRVNSHSRSLEEALIRRGIPYRVVGGTRFYDRREIKDAMSYMRLVLNPSDEVALRRVVNVPKRGVGDQSFAKVVNYSAEAGLNLYDALLRPAEAGVSGRAASGISDFVAVLDRLREAHLERTPPKELIELMLEVSGYRAELDADTSVEGLSRIDNLNELISVASPHETLEEFLDASALVSQADSITGDDAVTLMTVHTAKGLEFPVVFIAAMEDGIFPHSRSMYEPAELEEERRLCYVGVTRAREVLYLTRARMRSTFGEPQSSVASRFLEEIPADLLADLSAQRSYDEERRSYSAYTSASGFNRSTMRLYGIDPDSKPQRSSGGPRLRLDEVRVGTKVVHGSWGEGRVTAIEGSGDSATVSVNFGTLGVKKLILAYAPLKLA
ncbi:MAG: UvrD-helicase domain-containing protein [Actinomycetota bacterium]|nr:UvrD-helicase domain-containing protein [Actinomycetota bacterium]